MRGLLPSLPRSEREIKHFRRVCFNENRQNHEKNRQRRAKIFRDMYFNPIFFLGFLLLLIPSFAAETQTCLAVYKEGGAPAVFQSPNCPRWSLPADAPGGPPTNCQVAVLQGRRRSQEDRAVCVLDIRIPFLGRRGIKEILVGIVAVFDGHNGAEASDLASKLLVEYFSLHVYFLLDGIYSATLKKSAEKLTYGEEQDVIIQVLESAKKESWLKWGQKRSEWSSTIFDESFHLEILKESLLRTIHDIDVTFSKEALKVNLDSGSTATVVLLADGRILVANVGDSKAFLCSESSNPFLLEKGCNSKLNRRRRHEAVISPVNVYKGSKMAKYNAVGYYAKELTRDHHLARDDERNRVEAAGGYVVEWAGVLRVNGELALSRAIGDVPFKRYGVISIPEVTDWQYITENDSFLVTASDGVFEKMTTQEVCQVLWDENLRSSGKPWCVHASSHSCADSIVNNAFERGSMDNLAAVVLPLRSVGFAEAFFQDQLDISDLSSFRLQNIINQQAEYQVNNGVGTSILSSNYYQNIIAKFDRLMIEARNKTFGCFYLSENLNNDMEYIFQSPKTVKESAFSDLDHRVLEPVDSYSSGGSLDLYNDPKFCWHFGIHEGDKGQCTSPEVFKSFLGLLDSVSYNDTKSNHTKPFGHGIPDLRYKLKRRFDRGSYGEVWLAFRWNCSNEHDASHSLHSDQTYSLGSPRLNTHWYNVSPSVSPSNESCSSNSSDGDSFILKRIMVEQGSGAYLSGLREKYFGEIFLNASFSLKDTPISTSFSKEDEIHSDNMIWNDISDVGVKAFRYDFRSTHVGNFKTPKANGDEGLEHIARFVESFESESNEIWLVFHMEGLSLSKLIYTAEEVNSLNVDEMDENVRRIQVVHPSKWWHWLRTTEAGKKEMQSLIWQLLMALKSCHDRNITHRDIKPENMIICFEEVNKGKCLREAPPIGNNQYHIKLRIIDFGSAMDDFTLKHLYGSGPTRSEQSFEYTPPEALLNASWFLGPSSVRLKYDMWSVGVFMLELILGSPHVFQISDRTRALLDQHLEGWSEPTKELACKLRSYMEMCILVPGISPHSHKRNGIKDHGGVWPASWKCSEESFSNQVKNRDPLKLGFPNIWALRLVRQLLVWHPEDRFSVDEALQHPYFDSHR